MYGMNQQGGFASQAQQVSAQSKQQYKPAGFVQSYYKGGISKQNAGPVISHTGYQASQQQMSFAQPRAFGQQPHQQMQQQAGMQMGQAYQQQPVISRVGYTSGQDYYPKAAAHQQATSQFAAGQASAGQFQSQPVIAHAGGYQASSNVGAQSFAKAQTQQNPVYQATNAAAQEGPVLSHVGGYQAGSQSAHFGAQFGQMSNRF